MTQRFYLLGFLLLTAFLSGWLVWHYVVNFQWEAPANPRNPDAFVNDLQVIVMNAQGKPAYQFTSPHMLHYTEGDRTFFTLPYLMLYEDSVPPWIIQANQGEAFQGHSRVKLWGVVSMSQAKSSHSVPTMIKTEEAVIYPKQHMVTTDKYISAVQPAATAEGVGMKLDMIHKTLDLFSHVRGIYAPAKQQ